jgi:diacylglycerol kinase (ATP)
MDPIPKLTRTVRQQQSLLSSVGFACDGMLRTLLTQRNMKIHWVSGTAVMLIGMALNLDLTSRASVIFCVVLVLGLETLNTAFEAFVDLHIKQYEKQAMIAKDAAAAAVLLLALGAVVVFTDILIHRWDIVASGLPAVRRTLVVGLPLLSALSALLWLPRHAPTLTILGGLACAGMGFLAWFSRDEVFSLGAVAFVVGACVARFRQPTLCASASANEPE